MAESVTFDEVWESIKSRSGSERIFLESAEDAARVIETLSNARISQGISRKELAEMCHVSESAIWRLEGIQGEPSLFLMTRVACALGLHLCCAEERPDKGR